MVSGLTIDDFEKLPDALALNHELVDGELIDVSGNTARHNRLRDLLISLLLPFVEQRKLGLAMAEQEYKFGDNAHAPDVTFITSEKARLLKGNLRVQRFVPDLAIEIVSESDKFNALFRKAKRYRDYGTKEIWIFSIDNRQAYVYSDEGEVILNDNDEFCSALIPGFSIRIGELFHRIQ